VEVDATVCLFHHDRHASMRPRPNVSWKASRIAWADSLCWPSFNVATTKVSWKAKVTFDIQCRDIASSMRPTTKGVVKG